MITYIKMLQPFMYSQKWQLQGQFSCPSAVGMGINGRIDKGDPHFSFNMSCQNEFGMTSLFVSLHFQLFLKYSQGFIKFIGTLTAQSDHRVGFEKNRMDRQTDAQTL